jgi:hypothetical protein
MQVWKWCKLSVLKEVFGQLKMKVFEACGLKNHGFIASQGPGLLVQQKLMVSGLPMKGRATSTAEDLSVTAGGLRAHWCSFAEDNQFLGRPEAINKKEYGRVVEKINTP